MASAVVAGLDVYPVAVAMVWIQTTTCAALVWTAWKTKRVDPRERAVCMAWIPPMAWGVQWTGLVAWAVAYGKEVPYADTGAWGSIVVVWIAAYLGLFFIVCVASDPQPAIPTTEHAALTVLAVLCSMAVGLTWREVHTMPLFVRVGGWLLCGLPVLLPFGWMSCRPADYHAVVPDPDLNL